MIVAIEGVDGAGKSTLAEGLVNELIQRNMPAQLWSIPRCCPEILPTVQRFSTVGDLGTSYALQAICASARLSAIQTFKRDDVIVVSDRYKASSRVYGTSFDLMAVWCEVLEDPLPDASVTFLLDIPPAVGLARRGKPDAIERDVVFQERVRNAYLQLAALDAQRGSWCVLDGRAAQEEIVRQAAARVVEEWGRVISVDPPPHDV